MSSDIKKALAIVEKYGMKGDVIYREIAALEDTQNEADELDAWECPECGGAGQHTVYHKVTHLLGTDEVAFLDKCEVCEAIGSCGPDAKKRAALLKTARSNT